MFKVLANVYHNYPASERIVKFYKDRATAVSYMEVLSSVLGNMQNDGSVMSYDIQVISGCREDE